MKVFSSINQSEITDILRDGGVGILRTDTLYGMVARADNQAAVERIYGLKGRDDDKSPIVLIASSAQIYDEISAAHRSYVESVWPGPVSVIIPSSKAPLWIRRGNDSVAYRLPDVADLRSLLSRIGPLIAPSANPQGSEPALSLQQAVEYFADSVDFYVDGGMVTSNQPSQLMRLEPTGEVTRLR